MRAGQALRALELCAGVAALMLLQLGAECLGRGKGVRHSRDRAVGQLERLAVAGKFAVIACGLLRQRLDIAGAVRNDERARLGHAEVILRQDLQEGRVVIALAQQGGLLVEQAAVFGQRGLVIRAELADDAVHQSAAAGRALFEDHKVLRAEQHARKHAGQGGAAALLYPGEPQLARPPAGKQHGAQLACALLRLHLRAQLRKVCAEADELRLAAGAERAARGEIADGLEQVRLAVGVPADEEIHAWDELRLRILVIPEAAQAEAVNLHARRGRSTSRRQTGRRRRDGAFCRAWCTARR